MSERVTGKVQVIFGRIDPAAPRWRRPYTYNATEPVGVGDIVVVDTPMERQLATVVELSSDYSGPTRDIVSIAERGE